MKRVKILNFHPIIYVSEQVWAMSCAERIAARSSRHSKVKVQSHT